MLSQLRVLETEDTSASDAATGHSKHTDQLSSRTERRVLFDKINCSMLCVHIKDLKTAEYYQNTAEMLFVHFAKTQLPDFTEHV